MKTKNTTIPGKIRYGSFLIGILYLIGKLSLCEDMIRRGRPYVYPTITILQLLIVKTWMRIPSNNTLHYFLLLDSSQNKKILKACRIHDFPDRRTFDRRFKVLPISKIISNMGGVLLSEKLVGCDTASVDSSVILARGPVWHKSDMEQDRIPISGIDTDARWGFSKSKGWVFGYKMHMSCSTGNLVVPLSADFTTANIADNQMYCPLVDPLADLLQNIVADPAYDDSKLYMYSSMECNLRLICPVKKYNHTPPERLELAEFYESDEGQKIYQNRKVSIEPLFETLKDTFGIRVSPVRGFANAGSFVLVCVLVYQLMVYYNCLTEQENPRIVKRMMCS